MTSKQQMRKDFHRLANERLYKFVSDMLQLYEIAEIDEATAAIDILLALYKASAKVVIWGELNIDEDDFKKVLQDAKDSIYGAH